MKRKVIPLIWLLILVAAFLVMPVAAAGLMIVDGEKITTTAGATSPVISITDEEIAQDGTVTIDLSIIQWFIGDFTPTNDTVVITDSAANADWTRDVSYDDQTYSYTLKLTSTGGPTTIGENVTVTFTGAVKPWISDSGGEQNFPVMVTRDDGLGDGTFNFVIETVPPLQSGLIITSGGKITAPDGTTSPIITIADSDIEQDGTITIDISNLHQDVASGTFTDANVIVSDTATAATWTGAVDANTNLLTLTSTDGRTTIGETITVTFTGAAGNPWKANSGGEQTHSLTAIRTDGLGYGYFDFVIETTGGLAITDGLKITAFNGVTSPVITITGSDIAQDSAILIDISGLHAFVADGTFADTNIVVSDTAAKATWAGAVDGNTNLLTLTSTGGPTTIGETITLTFTGATNPWVSNTGGEMTHSLTAIRTDGIGSGSFNFVIETSASPNLILSADFSASPTSDIAPMTVSFADLSKGSPTEWSWDFGDGTTSPDQNPDHIYTQTGLYTVTLTVWNAYSMSLTSKTNYINVMNGAIVETDTGISGLTITNCGGPQTVTVNTSILAATLDAANSVLEIQPPPGSGFKNITFIANTRGFAKNGDIISGTPARVHLESEDIAPPAGFSSNIGTFSSFHYSIDLPSYPCKAHLSTKIWEGVIPAYDNLLYRIAAKNNVTVSGTAYTVKVTKSNVPPGASAKVSFSINASWITSLSDPGRLFIWRISDDEKSGQILHTNFLKTDPVTNLAYYEADSPLGFSTFGISSIRGSNNPFQVVAFVAAQAVNSGSGTTSSTESQRAIDAASGVPTPDITQNAPVEENKGKPAPLTQPAMSTNVGMVGWLLAIIENNPLVLAMIIAVVAVVAYFGWYKRRL